MCSLWDGSVCSVGYFIDGTFYPNQRYLLQGQQRSGIVFTEFNNRFILVEDIFKF